MPSVRGSGDDMMSALGVPTLEIPCQRTANGSGPVEEVRCLRCFRIGRWRDRSLPSPEARLVSIKIGTGMIFNAIQDDYGYGVADCATEEKIIQDRGMVSSCGVSGPQSRPCVESVIDS